MRGESDRNYNNKKDKGLVKTVAERINLTPSRDGQYLGATHN